MNIHLRLVLPLLLLALVGCGGTAMLIDKNGKQSMGKFDAFAKTLEMNIDGKLYSGFYIVNSAYSYGSAQAFSGTKSAYATSSGYVSGNTGRAILRSADGDTLTCEFNYQGMKGIGECVRSDGERYQMMAN